MATTTSVTSHRAPPGPAALLFVLTAALLVHQLAAPCAADDAVSCSATYVALMPCLGYVESDGTTTVPPAECCAGIKQLASGTAADHRAICACLKDLAAAAPAPYVGRAAGLPDSCGVPLGYKLSPDMDCNSIN